MKTKKKYIYLYSHFNGTTSNILYYRLCKFFKIIRQLKFNKQNFREFEAKINLVDLYVLKIGIYNYRFHMVDIGE